MLTPNQLDKLPAQVSELYESLEQKIVADMARRIVKTNYATESAQWELIRMQQLSASQDYIFTELTKATGKTKKELISMFNEAARTTYDSDTAIYQQAGFNTIPLTENKQLQRIINAGLVKTNRLFNNLTSTTAKTATQQLEKALDSVYMQVVSGAFDYNTAIRSAIKDLASGGIESIRYPSGHVDKIDVVVRRAALTGVNQTALQMQTSLADEVGSDLVETSAHMGARPSHENWQGRVFSRSGTSDKYPDFVSSTGYGTGAGLGGWNCRHSFFPFFEGLSVPAYSNQELNSLSNKNVEYNNEKYSEYEASQIQRNYERKIRATRRELVGYDAGIKASTDPALKAELQEAFDTRSMLLKKQESKLKDFCKQTGLRKDGTRVQVNNFNKSVSQKAVVSNKKLEKLAESEYNLGSVAENRKAYLRDVKTRALLKSDRTIKTIYTGRQDKHFIGHNNYTDGRSYLTVTKEEAQELINKYAGTGQILRYESGAFANKELIIADKLIGVNVDNLSKYSTPTNRFIIHYSNKGTHIVPTLKGVDKQ